MLVYGIYPQYTPGLLHLQQQKTTNPRGLTLMLRPERVYTIDQKHRRLFETKSLLENLQYEENEPYK